jgi:hypothetical protein
VTVSKEMPAIVLWRKSDRPHNFNPNYVTPAKFAAHWTLWWAKLQEVEGGAAGVLSAGGGGTLYDLLFFMSWWGRRINSIKRKQDWSSWLSAFKELELVLRPLAL